MSQSAWQRYILSAVALALRSQLSLSAGVAVEWASRMTPVSSRGRGYKEDDDGDGHKSPPLLTCQPLSFLGGQRD